MMALALAAISTIATAQTIVNVSAFGALPNDGLDDTAQIQNALNALANGDTLLFNTKGTYELTRAPAGWPGMPGVPMTPLLSLTGKSNITITAVPSVRIELTGYDRSVTTARYPNVLEVLNCPNFVLAGAGPNDPLVFDTRGAATPTPTNEGLPFVQGVLTNVNTAARVATIKVSDPEMFLPLSCTPNIWGAWEVIDEQPGTNADWSRGSVQAIAPPSGGTQLVDLAFTAFPYAQPHAGWTLGSDVVVLLNSSDTYAVLVYNCPGSVVLRDIVAHHLPGKFVQSGGQDDMLVDNVDVMPEFDTRLLSVCRDGINASAKHLIVRDCNLSGCGDDGIVANGSAYGVVTAFNTTNKTFRVEPPTPINPWPSIAKVGEHLVLLDQTTMDAAPLEIAEIQAIQYTQTPPTGPFAILDYTYTNETPGFAARLATGSCFTYNPWWSLYGARVENCTVEKDRGVGITVRSINTTISQCTVYKASVLGIHAGGGMVDAYPWYSQGAPPHNLRIEYCYIDSCGGLQPYSALTGSIEITVARASVGSSGTCTYWINPIYPTSPQAILDVTLDSNVIRSSRRAGVFASNVGGASGMQITNNWLIECGQPDLCHPEYNTAIVLDNCGSGQIMGNLFYSCANKTAVTNSPNVVIGP